MSDNCDYAQLYRIAKRYYIDNFSQAKIAVEESISRPHVSRLLAKARELGIVRISVQMPFSYESLAIANKLKERLGLSRVELACFPGQDGYSEERLSLAIATHASAILPELLSESKNIGVGWGHTVYQTSMLLERQSSNPEKTFIPLLGVSGEDNPHLQINVIANRFAEKFGAKSYYTIVPIVRESGDKPGNIEGRSYRRLTMQWKKLDTAIIGLGPAPELGMSLVAETSDEYNRQLVSSRTVGDILANFFYSDGSVFDSSQYYFQISLELERLRKLKTVICLAGGRKKVDGIVAAARNRFFNILVTDVKTATMILDRIEKE